MSTVVEHFADEERQVIDYLISRLPDLPAQYQAATVGQLPADWRTSSPPHLQVACDGAPEEYGWGPDAPLRRSCTIRITAWASSTTQAKGLARVARVVMLQHPARPGLGVVPAQDPETRAPIASFTVIVDQRPLV